MTVNNSSDLYSILELGRTIGAGATGSSVMEKEWHVHTQYCGKRGSRESHCDSSRGSTLCLSWSESPVSPRLWFLLFFWVQHLGLTFSDGYLEQMNCQQADVRSVWLPSASWTTTSLQWLCTSTIYLFLYVFRKNFWDHIFKFLASRASLMCHALHTGALMAMFTASGLKLACGTTW